MKLTLRLFTGLSILLSSVASAASTDYLLKVKARLNFSGYSYLCDGYLEGQTLAQAEAQLGPVLEIGAAQSQNDKGNCVSLKRVSAR